MSDDPLFRAFLEEAAELVADFEAGLLRLEASPDDTELLNRIFRSAHTLKGNSAMLGLGEITRFTHALEDLLDRLRKGRCPITATVVDILLGSSDVLRALIASVRTGAPLGPEDAVSRDRLLDALTTVLHEPDAPVAAAATSPPIPRGDPGDDPGGPILEPAMAVELFDAEPFAADVPPAPVPPAPVPTVPGPAAAAPVDGPPPSPGEWPRRRRSDLEEATTIRVPVEKVDRLINLVGELVITQSMLAQTVADFSVARVGQLQEAVAQMDRHARELHERMMAVRMVPIRALFARFPRLVRDLAGTVGKQVALELSGEDTELDKTVIEKIGDPLTHLIRNAVDHGIETPGQRQAAGKPVSGRVRLEAYQQGGNIYIVVTDDGRGLDRERIVITAVQHGLVAPDQPLTDEEAFGLIFRPGLSTAERVTEVSGRGVGMDVVRRNMEALGGAITVRSDRGRGTTFRIKLPLTLAIMDGQALKVGGQVYLLPITAIVESVRPRPGAVRPVLGRGEAILVRGQALPLVRLHRLLDVESRVEEPADGLVVIVDHEGRLAALLVDELLGQQQVVIKSLESNFQKVDGIAGATILGNGRVALILDVPGLVALARCGRPAVTREPVHAVVDG